MSEMNFGETLRQARRKASKTLLDLAKAGNVTVAYVSKIERGEKNPPDQIIIKKFLRVLECKERLSEFLEVARTSVGTVKFTTKGKSRKVAMALTRLSEIHEDSDSDSEEIWAAITKIINNRKAKMRGKDE